MADLFFPGVAESELEAALEDDRTIPEMERMGLVQTDVYGTETIIMGVGYKRVQMQMVPGITDSEGRPYYNLISITEGYRLVEGRDDVRDRRQDDNWIRE